MNHTTALRALVLGTTCLVATPALADDDEFSISDSPAPKAAPVTTSTVEGGIGVVTDGNHRFGRFNGLTDNGAFPVGNVSILRRQPYTSDDPFYVRAEGSRLGTTARALSGEVGLQGQIKAILGYDQIPFNEYDSGRTPLLGVGGADLTLPPDWRTNPAGQQGTATQLLPTLASALRPVDIKTERKRYSGAATWTPDRHWTVRAAFQRETKDGLKPLGVAWGTGGGNPLAIIVPEPVDYVTDRFDGEVGWAADLLQVKLGYQLSMFRNGKDTLTVQNPFANSAWNTDGRGGANAGYPNGRAQMALPPDNRAHTVTLSGGWDIGPATRLTTNLSYSQYLQTEDLLAYTANPLLRVVQGLPTGSLDGKIATTMANVELATRPMKDVDVRLKYRFTDRDNQTPRALFVYVAGDAEAQQIGGAQTRYRFNQPYSYTENLASADVGYRLARDTKLSAGYEFRVFERTYSAREENTDHTARFQIRQGLGPTLAATAKASRTWRTGSNYNVNAALTDSYTPAFVASLGAAVFENHPLLRQYFLADMVRDRASATLTWTPRADLTLGLTGSAQNDDYRNSVVGLQQVSGASGTLDASWSVSEALTLSGFYSLDYRRAEQAGWSFSGAPAATKLVQAADPARRWWVQHDDRAHTLGASLRWQLTDRLNLTGSYAYTLGQTDIAPRSGGAFAATPFPSVVTRVHSVGGRLEYDLTETTTLGLGYAFERYTADDWALDRVQVNTIGRVLTFGELNPNYNTHLMFVTARVKF